ncbi:MAG: DUF488 family protein [Chloroflexota bacterium]
MKYDEITLQIKNINETPNPDDGFRVLVDRHWPGTLAKDDPSIDLWLGDIAPSPALRKWFNGEAARWDEFLDHYFAELDENPQGVTELFQKATSGKITLLYTGKDAKFNQAAALKMYLEGED